jgi:hypothetical protein
VFALTALCFHIFIWTTEDPPNWRVRLDLAQDELPVDNFFTEIFFNDFNAQPAKSYKSTLFIDFRPNHALFQCPAGQGVKKALQALIG